MCLLDILCLAPWTFTLCLHSLLFSNRIRGPLCRFLELSLCVAPSSLLFCPQILVTSVSPISDLPLQLRETAPFDLCCCSLERASRLKPVCFEAQLMCPLLSEITVPHCLLSSVWNSCFMCPTHFFICLRQWWWGMHAADAPS